MRQWENHKRLDAGITGTSLQANGARPSWLCRIGAAP